jgi:structural maintenance of chromosomes protein 6
MPFRAMDEFDVFMDAINRRMAMQSLFGFAREHDELQYVFLTPQDLSAVEAARQHCEKSKMVVPEDFVKVVQMRPARQNATVA